MTPQLYIGFFGWLLYIAICIVFNYVKITKYKIKPRYFVSNQWRVFFGLVFLIIVSAGDGFDGIDFAYPRTLIPYIPHMVYILSSFYTFFDLGLNGLRGKRWSYRGKDSGWLDKTKIVVYYSIKVVALIGLIISIIMIWK